MQSVICADADPFGNLMKLVPARSGPAIW